MRRVTAVAVLLAVGTIFAASQAQPAVAAEPVPEESVQIYAAFLRVYLKTEERTSVNLARATVPLELKSGDGESCAKGIDPASVRRAQRQTHVFGDAAKLGANITLVDAEKQRQIIRANDPDAAIRKGQSVESAVEQAFSSGILTLSEIAFSADHSLAIFSYGFYCGGLCGHGAEVVMQKTETGWEAANRPCSHWMSRLDSPGGPGASRSDTL